MTRAKTLVIAPEIMQIVDEGDGAENEEGSADENNVNETRSTNASEADDPRSIDVRPNREEIRSPTSISMRD